MNEELLVCEKKIVSRCFGVPLLLEVAGTWLKKKSDSWDSWEDSWEDSWQVSFYPVMNCIILAAF
jgi:hypothetical protein